jgi:zinc transporter ZupT
VPLALLAVVLGLFLTLGGTGIGRPDGAPPQEELSVERTILRPGEIELHVRNNGLDSVTVAQVSVNDRYVSFTGGDASIGHLDTAHLVFPYPWIGSEAYEISLLLSTGTTIATSIEAAVETPEATFGFYGLMALLGTYVGIIPVMLGLLWLPFFRAVGWRWFRFLMAVTIGLLLFLVVEAVLEGIDTAQGAAPAFGGALLVFAGALLAYLVLKATDAHLRTERERAAAATGAKGFAGANVALLVSIGIGLHNLSEGLGIGAAYAIGAVAFGTFLVVGFTIQNVTEGLAIVAPLAHSRPSVTRLVGLGLIAGVPAIVGAWLGSIAFDASLAALLFGVAAGAIVQVTEVLWPALRDSAGRAVNFLSTAGIALGFGVLYVTSLFT